MSGLLPQPYLVLVDAPWADDARCPKCLTPLDQWFDEGYRWTACHECQVVTCDSGFGVGRPYIRLVPNQNPEPAKLSPREKSLIKQALEDLSILKQPAVSAAAAAFIITEIPGVSLSDKAVAGALVVVGTVATFIKTALTRKKLLAPKA